MPPLFARGLMIVLLLGFYLGHGSISPATAHPLGNFTVNQYARITVGAEQATVRYVIDMAEISTLQELQNFDSDKDGKPSTTDLDRHLQHIASEYLGGLVLRIEDTRIPFNIIGKTISLVPGAGGLPTLRIVMDLAGSIPVAAGGSANGRRLTFQDNNRLERIGWREIVVKPAEGVSVYDSAAYGNGLTDELKAYPQEMLAAPLREEAASLSFKQGAAPAGAAALRTRDGHAVVQTRDRLAELVNVPALTPIAALLGLVIAAGFGTLHAFSPGHGKTVVGAYLVGGRASMKHAAVLGLTVTVTHTLGVFALGIVTLFASKYILPEQLFPVLSLVSGVTVLVLGFSLFLTRLQRLLGSNQHAHHHANLRGQIHGGAMLVHSHGGREHSHLPPGADGVPIKWRSLLALGVSGGLLPCPSALVLLLSAISLHRAGYGLMLVIAFSFGLAATLTAIGLAVVYAGRWMKRPTRPSFERIVRVLPAASAFIIAIIGAGICYEALDQAGAHIPRMLTGLIGQTRAAFTEQQPALASAGVLAVLGLGLVFGLKHATEVDHVVAVSTIVSEHRNLWRAALVGGIWGIGHTASLIAVGVVVLALRIAVPVRIADILEFSVALMILALGANALTQAFRRTAAVRAHPRHHHTVPHAHLHVHLVVSATRDAPRTRFVTRIGWKPLLVGAMHGLAGSGALTLLVLTQIDSALIGLAYLVVFGLGSIVGMLLMSCLVGLPFALRAGRLKGMHSALQASFGVLSIGFGCWYAYETGVANGLLFGML